MGKEKNFFHFKKTLGIALYTTTILKLFFFGSLSTVVGDEKLTSRENLIGFLFLYVQSDENTLPKVNKVSKTEAQTFDVFDKLIDPLQFCI